MSVFFRLTASGEEEKWSKECMVEEEGKMESTDEIELLFVNGNEHQSSSLSNFPIP